MFSRKSSPGIHWCLYNNANYFPVDYCFLTCLHVHAFYRAFTGDLVDNKKEGIYRCTVCGKELFLSDTKFDSGSGWPSFWETVEEESVRKIVDTSHGMTRTEVTCADVSRYTVNCLKPGTGGV